MCDIISFYVGVELLIYKKLFWFITKICINFITKKIYTNKFIINFL